MAQLTSNDSWHDCPYILGVVELLLYSDNFSYGSIDMACSVLYQSSHASPPVSGLPEFFDRETAET